MAAITSSELRRPGVGRRSVRSAGGVDFGLMVRGRSGGGRESCQRRQAEVAELCLTDVEHRIGSGDELVPKNLRFICRLFSGGAGRARTCDRGIMRLPLVAVCISAGGARAEAPTAAESSAVRTGRRPRSPAMTAAALSLRRADGLTQLPGPSGSGLKPGPATAAMLLVHWLPAGHLKPARQ